MKINHKLINRIIFTLGLFGLGISTYLLYTYVAKAPIVCLDSGCEIVRASSYSYFLGLPLPAYGLVMYVFIIILSFLITTLEKIVHHHLANKLIFAAAAIGVLTSAYLTYLEAFVIKAYCTWCVTSAIVIVVIFILSVFELRRFK